MSNLSESLTVAHLIWAKWANHSQSHIWFEQNEQLSDEPMSEVPALLFFVQNTCLNFEQVYWFRKILQFLQFSQILSSKIFCAQEFQMFAWLFLYSPWKAVQMQCQCSQRLCWHYVVTTKLQGWEFAHRFLRKNEQMSDLLKKMSNSLIHSFLVIDLSDLLTLLIYGEQPERFAYIAHQKWGNERIAHFLK